MDLFKDQQLILNIMRAATQYTSGVSANAMKLTNRPINVSNPQDFSRAIDGIVRGDRGPRR